MVPTSLSAKAHTLPKLDELLPSDHKLVTWETAFFPPCPPGPKPIGRHRKTGRWKVDTDRLQDSLMHLAPPRCDWKRLCLLANTCQYRRPSLKFKDSTELKRLCHLRNSTEDANQRASMSRHIIATRRAERAQWLQSLHAAASSGDPSAIAFLKAKQKAPSDWSQLVAHAGSQPEAIQNVRNHFQQTFATTPLDTRAADCAPHIATLETHMANTAPQPITTEEVHKALGKLKMGKTSGASGMSNELLMALGNAEDGLALLLRILNCMFIHGQMPPDLHLGIACLIPKSTGVTVASQIRPILLLEVLQKLYAGILMQRLAPHWPPLNCQLGAVSGGQPIEALFAAQHMVALATVTNKDPLFVKLDIKGAFDNLRHASVAAFLARMPETACYEAMRLLTLLLDQKIQFSFLNTHWDIHSTNGTPQGGSHSAGLFARTLDHAIGTLTTDWEAAGHIPLYPPLWMLLFVDDILLCFNGWRQAAELLPTLVECLSELGLEINFAKSCLVIRDARHLSSSPPQPHNLELLRRFPCVHHTQYLRKSFGYHLDVDALHQQAIQSIFAAWGKLKPVLQKAHWTHPHMVVRMLDQYIGSAFLWMSPSLYPYQHFKHKLLVVQTTLLIESLNLYIPQLADDETYQLLRLRRHIVKLWIRHMTPHGSWTSQFLRRYWSFIGHICRQNFSGKHPARVMLYHVIEQHNHRLNRPGPWSTPHSLVAKFWKDNKMEGDYIHVASDRDAWKALTNSFLQWHNIPLERTNVEFLDAQPWDHPKYLLRYQLAWLQVVFINATATFFEAVWLDQIHGFSTWTIEAEAVHDVHHSLITGLTGLCLHLCMLGQPFSMQLAVPNEMLWTVVIANRNSINETLMKCNYASWYQLFPLNPSECKHRVLRSCFTNFSSPLSCQA